MPTLYLHRLVIVATNARAATVNAWIKTNLNPEGEDWLSVPLSATGNLPATHLGCSAAVTNAQARLMMRAICQALSEPLPSGTGWTRAQWKTWLAGILAALRAKGVSIQWTDQDGEWGSFDAEAAESGLQRVRTEP